MNEELKTKLVAMVEKENQLKEELAMDGSLYNRYPERIRKLHLEQANELEKIVEEHGWPKYSLVGKEAADAAWLILQHSISRPAMIKKFYLLLESAVNEKQASAKHLACLTDCICFFSRKPQVYGSYFDWDKDGKLNPWEIKDREKVNERRKSVGLNTLEERMEEMEKDAKKNSLSPPKAYAKRQAEMIEFLKEVGWI